MSESGAIDQTTPGPPGPPGQDGLDGQDGDTGAQGQPGVAGAQGQPGVAGASGPPGQDGLDGQDGDTGAQGALGATGTTGATGPAGPAGPPGQDGDDGIDGLDGRPGTTPVYGTWNPTISQGASVNIAHTVLVATFVIIDKLLLTWGSIAMTATGTAGSDITVSMPFATGPGLPGNVQVGSGFGIFANAAPVGNIKFMTRLTVATALLTFRDTSNAASGNSIGTTPSFALASGDVIQWFSQSLIA